MFSVVVEVASVGRRVVKGCGDDIIGLVVENVGKLYGGFVVVIFGTIVDDGTRVVTNGVTILVVVSGDSVTVSEKEFQSIQFRLMAMVAMFTQSFS